MSERGEYRAIARVLLDGPDYQQLSERARHVFLALKISFGPAGIEVVYPESLRAELHTKTGAPHKAIAAALQELIDKEWIRIERNIVWIVDQLRFDPHMKVVDWKHRLSIQRHIAGMPRLRIVADFVAKYRSWFVDRDGKPIALPSALQGPFEAPATTRPMTDDITDDITNTKDKTDDDARTRVHTPEEPADGPADVEQAADLVIMSANRGLLENLGEAFNPIPVSHGSRQNVIEWLGEGIPLELLKTAVYETALRYKPNGRHRQINTMKYFADSVHEAFDLSRAGNTPAPKRSSRSASPQKFDYSNSTTEFKGLKV